MNALIIIPTVVKEELGDMEAPLWTCDLCLVPMPPPHPHAKWQACSHEPEFKYECG